MAGATKRISVMVRVRPMTEAELCAPANKFTIVPLRTAEDVEPPADAHGEACEAPPDPQPYFDAVFRGAEATQAQVFDTLGLPLLERLLSGTNVCVLAYGQTGAGKTHTMMGPAKASAGSRDPSQKGLIPRFLYELQSRRVTLEATGVVVEIEAQYVEIYRDKMYDLLKASGRALDKSSKAQPPAALGARGLANALRLPLTDGTHMTRMLEEGEARRRVGPKPGHACSSRSHALLCVHVVLRAPRQTMRASAFLVDLAGSEDIGDGGDRDAQMETTAINASLFHLRRVVEDLASAQASGEARELQHSLRSSKLTEALRGALAGASDTAVVLAVSPSSSHEVESERTLRFGLAAARVRTTDVANVELSPEVAVVQEQIEEQIAIIAEMEAEAPTEHDGKVALMEAKLLRDELRERMEQEDDEARARLQMEKELQAALDARLGSLKSVYGTLRHGVAPSLLTDNPAVGELIDNPVRCWERQLDDGLADADALILRVFTKVQAWLAQWKDTLGVDHVERDGAEPTTSSGILPRERWVRERVVAAHEATLALQPELFGLENQKDFVATHYVRLAAALNSVDRELGAALDVALQRPDLSRRTRAVLNLTGRVMEQARQRLAVKQAMVEDKGDEVVEHLQRICALKLGELVALLPRGRRFRPRLAVCATWQDMLPLAADVLQCALDEMDHPTSPETAEELDGIPDEDPAGSHLGEAFAVLGGEGNKAAAWVTCIKGVKRLQVRTVVEAEELTTEEGEQRRRLAAGGEGVALQEAQVRRLGEETTLRGVDQALGSADHLTPETFETCLDVAPRMVAAAGGGKRSVALWVRVLLHEQRTGKYSVERTMRVDVRERQAEMKALRERAQRPSAGPGAEKGLTLTAVQWGALARLLPNYLKVLARRETH